MLKYLTIAITLMVSGQVHAGFQDIDSLRSIANTLKDGTRSVSVICENQYAKFEMEIFREALETVGDQFDESFEVFTSYKVSNNFTGRQDSGIGAGEIRNKEGRVRALRFSTKNDTSNNDIISLKTSRWADSPLDIQRRFWFFVTSEKKGTGLATGGFPAGIDGNELLFIVENCQQNTQPNPHLK